MSRFLPDDPLARRLVVRSVLSAVGSGAFLTGSAVYFTRIVGLTASQVGLGLTVGGVAAFLAAVPLGRLADLAGARRVWFAGALLTAGLFALWPLITSFAAFILLVVADQAVHTMAASARATYSLGAFTRADRVRNLAFVRSARNIGYTLGALLGGLALAMPSDAGMAALPLVTAALLFVDAVLILRLPEIAARPIDAGDPAIEDELDGAVDPEPLAAPAVTVASTPTLPDTAPDAPPDTVPDTAPGTVPDVGPTGRSALRNPGYLLASTFSGVLQTNQVLLNVVIPLWLVQQTDAPRVLLAWLFGTNTVLAVLLQVPATRGAHTVSGALRASRISAAFFVASCLIVLSTHDTIGWLTVVLIWVGHVTVTGAELFQSAGMWGFQAELSDPLRRGEYQGVWRVGDAIGSLWAPALYTWLAMSLHATGWLIIAAIVIVAAVALTPSVRAAERRATGVRPGAAPAGVSGPR